MHGAGVGLVDRLQDERVLDVAPGAPGRSRPGRAASGRCSGVPSSAAKQAVESNRGRHSQSIDPARLTRAAVSVSPSTAYSSMGRGVRAMPMRRLYVRVPGVARGSGGRGERSAGWSGLSVPPPTMVRVTSAVPARRHQHDQLIVRGAREHNLKDVVLELPRDSLIVLHRAVRVGQVVAGVRHDLRRGPAPLRRVAVGLRPPVPRPDGQARRRLHRGPVARPSRSTRSRPTATRGRRSARSPRSTTTCACCSRAPGRPHCPVCGEPITRQSPAADRRPAARAARAAPGSRCWRRSSAARKGEYVDLFGELQSKGFSRARVDGEVVVADRAAQAGEAGQAHHRRRGRPPRGQGRRHRGQAPAHRLGRDRARPGRRRPGRRVRRQATPRTPSASAASPSGWPAPTTTRWRWTRSSRARSRSTARSAPAPSAPASAPSSRSTPSCSSPTRTSPSPRARSRRGRRPAARPSTSSGS